MELLGFPLQMKTTGPAARLRWKPDGGKLGGGMGQPGAASACPAVSAPPRPLQPTGGCLYPRISPVPRWFRDAGFSHPGHSQPRRRDPEPREVTRMSDWMVEEEQQVAKWPSGWKL